MFVIKADGRKQEFSKKKILDTCLRSGISRRDAEKIVDIVSSRAYPGITTHEIFLLIQKEIEKRDERGFYFIRMRDSISRLDPSSFELYTKKILEAHGYKTEINRIIKGKYVEHEVDVVAYKDGYAFLVECKHHFNPHRFTGLGTCLQVIARMEDINAASRIFDSCWIFTNNKFSDHAIKYSNGIGIRLTGWHYQKGFELERLVSEKFLFPVTMLHVNTEEIRNMLESKIVTIKDVMERGRSFRKAYSEAKRLLKL